MGMTKIDTLGRIILPEDAIQKLSLTHQQNLLITLDEASSRLVLQPAEECADPFSTGREMRERQAAMKQLPTSQWRYIRGIDSQNMLVLPKAMRNVLGWTEVTPLHIFVVEGHIYIERTKNN